MYDTRGLGLDALGACTERLHVLGGGYLLMWASTA